MASREIVIGIVLDLRRVDCRLARVEQRQLGDTHNSSRKVSDQ
jgi:hypothetical protein